MMAHKMGKEVVLSNVLSPTSAEMENLTQVKPASPVLKTCDADGDKIPDPIDECPNIPEDYNGIQDSDGCPEPPSQCLGENCTLVSPNCNKCPCQYADFSNTLHPNDKVRARLRDLPTKKHYNFSNFAPLTSFILP